MVLLSSSSPVIPMSLAPPLHGLESQVSTPQVLCFGHMTIHHCVQGNGALLKTMLHLK